jgi:single-strand DNA-binding protein
MNNAVIQATLEYSPELRHTPDGKEISETVVSFEGRETVHTLKAIAWGNTAKTFHQELRQGDLVILDGSLQMNTVERPEGFKEKMAELVVQKFEKISGSPATPTPPPVRAVAEESAEPDPDDIPF